MSGFDKNSILTVVAAIFIIITIALWKQNSILKDKNQQLEASLEAIVAPPSSLPDTKTPTSPAEKTKKSREEIKLLEQQIKRLEELQKQL